MEKIIQNSYRFFKNIACRYYPCHKGIKEINCLFCYYPLYPFPDCGGNYSYNKNGTKVCTECIRPHLPENYDLILSIIVEKYHSKANLLKSKNSKQSPGNKEGSF
jgi:Zn-finger protein